MVECPHCLNRVFPMANHQCPSCLKDLRAKIATPMTKLTVTPTMDFPERCCECEAATQRLETVKVMGHGADPLWMRLVAGAFLLLSSPKALFEARKDLEGDPELYRVRVPRCEECAKKGAIVPDYVNPQQRTITLLVRRGFAEATRARSLEPKR